MPIRMEKHLENCTEYQASKRPRIVENTSECETVQKPKSTQENTLQKFTVKTSKDEVREIGIQLSRAIISSNSPFSLVEDPEFKKYHNLMRPGVPIPSRHTVGGDYLDIIYGQEIEKAKFCLTGL